MEGERGEVGRGFDRDEVGDGKGLYEVRGCWTRQAWNEGYDREGCSVRREDWEEIKKTKSRSR